jgi:uncharacterized protein with PQ loop repeat
MMPAEMFYSAGCTIMNIAMWPQLHKTYKTKKASDISPVTLIIILAEHVVLISWALWRKAWTATFVNVTTFVLITWWLVMYFRYKNAEAGSKDFLHDTKRNKCRKDGES